MYCVFPVNYLESVWEPPKVGYTSLEEQKMANSIEEPKINDLNEPKDKSSSNTEEKNVNEEFNVIKKRKIGEGGGGGDTAEAYTMGPAVKPDPYGGWTAVDRRFVIVIFSEACLVYTSYSCNNVSTLLKIIYTLFK